MVTCARDLMLNTNLNEVKLITLITINNVECQNELLDTKKILIYWLHLLPKSSIKTKNVSPEMERI